MPDKDRSTIHFFKDMPENGLQDEVTLRFSLGINGDDQPILKKIPDKTPICWKKYKHASDHIPVSIEVFTA